MFRIGEFSKLTQVSIRMLRYYDETGLLKPERIDKFTGYRLYDTNQIKRLNKIVFLRDIGFNVAEIAMALNEWEDGFITERLEQKRLDIEQSIQMQRDKLARIEQAKKDILHEKNIEINYSVTVKHIPSYQVFSYRKIIPDYYAEAEMWMEMERYVKENNIQVSEKTFSIYYDLEFKEKNVDVELCTFVDKMGPNDGGFVFRNTEEVSLMACTMVYGPFENISKAFLSFAGWLQEHNQYRMPGTSRQIVHRGPWNEKDPEKYLTEIQIPLEKNVDSHMV